MSGLFIVCGIFHLVSRSLIVVCCVLFVVCGVLCFVCCLLLSVLFAPCVCFVCGVVYCP